MFVLLTILGLILLIILFILIIKYKVELNGEDKIFVLRIKFLCFSIKVFPRKTKAKTKKQKEKSVKKASVKTAEKAKTTLDIKNINIGEATEISIKLLSDLKNAFIIEDIFIRALIYTGDAAKTAMLVGKIWAFIGNIHPVLLMNFKVKKNFFEISPCFDKEFAKSEYRLSISVRPIVLIFAVLSNLRGIKSVIKMIKQKEVA